MSEFKKGQLVAVRAYSDEAWEPAIFERKEGIFCICRSLLNRDARLERPWPKAKPAEEVWPEIFLGRERRASEQEADAVAMESALVQRLRRQIEWLCRQIQSLADIEWGNVCPPVGMSPDYINCQCNCIACWEQASLKAVKEDDADATGEEIPALGR